MSLGMNRYVDPGVHMQVVETSHMPSQMRHVRDDELRPGDLCSFWDVRGIYMGIVSVDFLDVSQSDDELRVWFNFIVSGQRVRLMSTLSFTLALTERVKPADVTVHALLVDDVVKYLPRITTSRVEYDDGLRVVSRL